MDTVWAPSFAQGAVILRDAVKRCVTFAIEIGEAGRGDGESLVVLAGRPEPHVARLGDGSARVGIKRIFSRVNYAIFKAIRK